jgi:hypothetical protein
VINFGRDEYDKYVLAESWAHFLEDVADELESGTIEVTRDVEGHVDSFGRVGQTDHALYNFYPEWAKAKLPTRFQDVDLVVKSPVLPGRPARGEAVDQAGRIVKDFFAAMQQFEKRWGIVGPRFKDRWKLERDQDPGFWGTWQVNFDALADDPEFSFRNPDGSVKTLPQKMMTMINLLYSEKTKPMRDPWYEWQLKLKNEAIPERQAIFDQFCTKRKRFFDGLKLCSPARPEYDADRDQIREVREVSSTELIVYIQPWLSVTTRYHLVKEDHRWLIDYRDKTLDHIRFRKYAM